MTALRRDTLTTKTWYPLEKWRQILLWLYSALSDESLNATTWQACTSNEVHDRNVAGPGTPHYNSIRHLGIIHSQRLPHNFPKYLTRQLIRSNYLGRCKRTNNLNDESSRAWHKIWSTAVLRQRKPSGIRVCWRHRDCGRRFNKDWNNCWRCLR